MKTKIVWILLLIATTTYAQKDMAIDSVVVGKDNKLGETVITALVFPNYDLFVDKTDEEVLEAIKDSVDKINKKLPTYKQVHSVEIRRTEFEKTTSRKIKRYKAQ